MLAILLPFLAMLAILLPFLPFLHQLLQVLVQLLQPLPWTPSGTSTPRCSAAT